MTLELSDALQNLALDPPHPDNGAEQNDPVPVAPDPFSEIDFDVLIEKYIPLSGEYATEAINNASRAVETNRLQSPFLRILPTEIISTMLCACLSPFSSYKSPHEPYDSTLPFRLASISSDVRSIALSTPELWSRPAFFLKGERHFLQTLHPQMQLWLSRSRAHPLSIRIVASSASSHDYWKPSTRTLLVQTLFAPQSRWKEADIRLSMQSYALFKDYIHNLPILESMLIKKPPGMQDDFIMDLSNEVAPNFRRLELTRFYLRSINVHWDRLTHLQLRQFYLDECIEVLSRAKTLVHFTVRRIIDGGDGYPWPPTEPLILPNLQVLNVSTDLRVGVDGLFEWTRAPGLKVLRCLSFRAARVPSEAITQWLKASQPTSLKVIITVFRPLIDSWDDDNIDEGDDPAFAMWTSACPGTTVVGLKPCSLRGASTRSYPDLSNADELVEAYGHGGALSAQVECFLSAIAP